MDQVLADTLTANQKSAGPWCRPLTLCPARTPALYHQSFERPNTRRAQRGYFSQLGLNSPVLPRVFPNPQAPLKNLSSPV